MMWRCLLGAVGMRMMMKEKHGMVAIGMGMTRGADCRDVEEALLGSCWYEDNEVALIGSS